MTQIKGKLIIICAPSGSGKTTIVKSVLPEMPELEFSVSATSRSPREGEVDGKDYYFITAEDFRKRVAEGAFLEWEEVYSNSYYGTLKSELERIWAKGSHVIFDVDVMGGLSIKKEFPGNSLAIFIMPPSLEELKKRLEGRATETPESLRKRVEKAASEIEYASKFDVTIVNENLPTAIKQTKEMIKSFLNTK